MRVSGMIKGLLVASVALTLGACGFTPMYGGSGLAGNLSDIRVETGEERVDFLLQEALLDEMGARHASGPLTLRTETQLGADGAAILADGLKVSGSLKEVCAHVPAARACVVHAIAR